ncbi:MAG: hypothetical protein QOF24_2348 [Verrucomicrobiota bacterium]|jgi:uncharacterized membrane protein
MLYLSHMQLPDMAWFTPAERRIFLLDFSASQPEVTHRRSRRIGYAVFAGQILGLIDGAVVAGSERGVLCGMLGGLVVSLAIVYVVGLYIDRAPLRAFVARSSRPIMPINDRVAVFAYHGKPPKA